jgi:phosphopantetheinyl transferase
MSAAIVLHAPLPAEPRSLRWESSLLQSLPYARRLQLEGRSAPQRTASLAGIALVLLGAERLTGQPVAPRNFSFPLDLKPSLAQGPEFSLSHSTRLVACCVTSGKPCGIDVEDTPLAANADGIDRLRHWTATEAILKAAGRGVRNMHEVRLNSGLASGFVGEGGFCLQPLAGLPGAIGHVASRAPLALSLLAVDLDGDELSAAMERSFSLAAQVE